MYNNMVIDCLDLTDNLVRTRRIRSKNAQRGGSETASLIFEWEIGDMWVVEYAVGFTSGDPTNQFAVLFQQNGNNSKPTFFIAFPCIQAPNFEHLCDTVEHNPLKFVTNIFMLKLVLQEKSYHAVDYLMGITLEKLRHYAKDSKVELIAQMHS